MNNKDSLRTCVDCTHKFLCDPGYWKHQRCPNCQREHEQNLKTGFARNIYNGLAAIIPMMPDWAGLTEEQQTAATGYITGLRQHFVAR